MELRQLRYFVKICELGSMGRAALELEVATSALSQQISRLESELSKHGLTPQSTTRAELTAFMRHEDAKWGAIVREREITAD
jgi:DNA-binding transcriptional LysR family regulator